MPARSFLPFSWARRSSPRGEDAGAAPVPAGAGRGEAAGRIPELDGIRGIAILLVLLWHYGMNLLDVGKGSVAYSLVRPVGLAWSGVDLFFVLSGFLLGGILMDNRESQGYFRVFYARRICRIFPLYFLWLALFLALEAAVPKPAAGGALSWLLKDPLPPWSYATYTQNLAMASQARFGPNWMGITWSLAIEEQFYLVLPFLVRFLSPRRLPYVLLGLVAAAPVARGVLVHIKAPGMAPYVLMPCRTDALLLGVLAAWAVRSGPVLDLLQRHRRAIYGGFIALGLLIVAIFSHHSSPVSSRMRISGYSLLAAFYALLLLLAVSDRGGGIARIARSRWLRGLGVLAYGVYMIHQAVSGLAHGLFRNRPPAIRSAGDIPVVLAALAATLGIAWLSWNLFEKRFVALGHSLRYRRRAPAAP